MKKELTIYLSVGEVSGDVHGAELVKALQATTPVPLRFIGTGGDAMQSAGVELYHHVDELATMGIWEVLKRIRFFRNLLRETVARIKTIKPDIFISIDYPGFNLRLAKEIRQEGLTSVHYISPKVWVWKANRIPKIAAIYDLLLCIFPFEPALFQSTKLKAIYVGNPLVAEVARKLNESPQELPWQGSPRIGLLPGSRLEEIRRLMPMILQAIPLIRAQFPQASFIIPTPTARIHKAVQQFPIPSYVSLVEGQSLEVMRQADCAVIASGTATLESVLANCPTILIYRVAKLTEWFARCVIRGIRHVGLANIIAQHEVIPELLQGDCNPERISAEVLRLLTDASAREKMRQEFATIRQQLGEGNASTVAAQEILKLITSCTGSASS